MFDLYELGGSQSRCTQFNAVSLPSVTLLPNTIMRIESCVIAACLPFFEMQAWHPNLNHATPSILNHGRIVIDAGLTHILNHAKRIEAVLLDGCLPKHELAQAVWQHIDRREWSMTVYPFDATMLHELEHNNPLSSITVHDLGIEQIMKDVIRGDRHSCSVY